LRAQMAGMEVKFAQYQRRLTRELKYVKLMRTFDIECANLVTVRSSFASSMGAKNHTSSKQWRKRMSSARA
jgi:hypothetical protein